VDEKKILQKIRERKAATVSELAKDFKIKHAQMARWLRKLYHQNKVKRIRIAGKGHAPSMRLFPGYTSRNIYYLSEEDMAKWVKQQLPPHMPPNLKKAIAHKLRPLNIELDKHTPKKAVMLDPSIHEKLKEKAEEKNMTITQLLEEMVKK